jgi:hypothetical protein
MVKGLFPHPTTTPVPVDDVLARLLTLSPQYYNNAHFPLMKINAVHIGPRKSCVSRMVWHSAWPIGSKTVLLARRFGLFLCRDGLYTLIKMLGLG